MIKVIMHGCNGKMGQTITGIVAEDAAVEIVAGVDVSHHIQNTYPVFSHIRECDVEADVVIDFGAAVAIDGLLAYCVEKQVPCVLCTTGLTNEQLVAVEEAAKKVAILKSANMSLGVNTLLKLLKDAAAVLEAYLKVFDANDDKDTWFNKIKELCEPLGFTPNVKEYKQNPDAFKGHVGDVSTVIRIAITSRRNTPDLHSIIALLGNDEIRARCFCEIS